MLGRRRCAARPPSLLPAGTFAALGAGRRRPPGRAASRAPLVWTFPPAVAGGAGPARPSLAARGRKFKRDPAAARRRHRGAASMAQVDGTAQKIQSKPARKQAQNVGSVRSWPLAGKSFYLDLPSGKTLEFLEKSVKRFGGVVESFLSKEVTCIVSNNQEAQKESWGRKQTAAVLRNTRSGTQTSVLVTRGKALLQKAIRTQSNICGSNSILASARSWGIQIMHTDDMLSYLQRLDSKCCHSRRQMKLFHSRPQSTLKVMRLQLPFLKVEDESRKLCPVLQQFKNFPELCFTEQRRHSPFDPPRSPASSKAPEGQLAHSNSSSDCFLVPKRRRGYCECCEETFVELQMHLQSPRHTEFVLDASHYAPVDSLISQMTNVFAFPSCFSLPRRVPPTASGDPSGCQEDVLQRIAASSPQPRKFCLSGECSEGWPASPGSSTHWPEDQSFWRWTVLPGEGLSTPVLPPSPSLLSLSGQAGGGSSGPEQHRRGGADADAPRRPAACPEAGSGAASEQTNIWAPPALPPSQPRKRKLSFSPQGQVRKRPALAGWPLSQLLPDTKALSGVPPAGPAEGSFSQECGSQTGPGCLRQSAAPVAKPHHCLHAPTQFPQEGSAWPPREQAAADIGCLERPLQPPLEQKQESAVHPSEEWCTQSPHKSPSADAKLGMPGFPTGTRPSSQPLGSAAQPRSGMGRSPFIEAVVPAWPGLGLPPLSCSEESSSSESEWDRPLLRTLEGTSRSPSERPIDSALLGACVSMQDSGYTSHLCSVLRQTLEPHEARERDADGCPGQREVLWAPFTSLGSHLDRRGPVSLNEPTPRV